MSTMTKCTNVTTHEITALIGEDMEVAKLVYDFVDRISGTVDKPIGYTKTQLDPLFIHCWRYESIFGNCVAGLNCFTYNTDVGFLCGETIRGGFVYIPCELTI